MQMPPYGIQMEKVSNSLIWWTIHNLGTISIVYDSAARLLVFLIIITIMKENEYHISKTLFLKPSYCVNDSQYIFKLHGMTRSLE